MTAELEFENGEKAEATALDALVLTFRSPRAFAPGAPIRFAVLIADQRRVFEGRSLGSKRIESGRFEVRMRFVNLRREDREALAEMIEPTSS